MIRLKGMTINDDLRAGEEVRVYDATCLYTAEKLGGVLITEDKELLSKSRQLGVESRTIS